ncbi:UNVERIFIED_CONTAM: hypothetical protein Slati_0411500 [Sesamum latifolium]|uniref:Endonuclease/exonuclease/phosphatase n=1 Tax=Sesamum latifolium TaxID=2727402 RepID=A0AAW2XUQ4_9LAMI
MEEFRSCLSNCQLVDLGFSGAKFTWCNQREASHRARVCLDQAYATMRWKAMFPHTRVMTEATRGSDHNPLVINLDVETVHVDRRRGKMFRFKAMWTRLGNCEDVVRSLWNHIVEGGATERVLSRLRAVRRV